MLHHKYCCCVSTKSPSGTRRKRQTVLLQKEKWQGEFKHDGLMRRYFFPPSPSCSFICLCYVTATWAARVHLQDIHRIIWEKGRVGYLLECWAFLLSRSSRCRAEHMAKVPVTAEMHPRSSLIRFPSLSLCLLSLLLWIQDPVTSYSPLSSSSDGRLAYKSQKIGLMAPYHTTCTGGEWACINQQMSAALLQGMV